MEFKEAVRYMDQAGQSGSRLGLECMYQLMKILGNPQDKLQFIHIAGTNGKGSVLAYLSSVLITAGYCTGTYSSPAVANRLESFQINGKMISCEQYAEHVETLKAAVDMMQTQSLPLPTLFELETALAFLYFNKNHCDIVVLETGLGGRLDATNIVSAQSKVLSVLTSISMDHAAILGHSLHEIAEQKAGIICSKVPVVMMESNCEITDVISKKCKTEHAELMITSNEQIKHVFHGFPIQRFSYGKFSDMEIGLLGIQQIRNAAVALDAVLCLQKQGFAISDEQTREGMRLAKWPFRMEQINSGPQFIVDGAHNPEAAELLAENLRLYFADRYYIYIIGVFRDKDYEKICEQTVPLAGTIITVQTPNSARALDANDLKATVMKYSTQTVLTKSLREAVKCGFEEAVLHERENPLIVAFGSLSYLAELKQYVTDMHKEKKDNN